MATAKQSLIAWSANSGEERCRLLERLAAKLRENRYDLAAWEVFEVGKNWVEADADVCEAIDFCAFYAMEMRRLNRGRVTQETAGEISIESYLPRGVGAIIAPWNFPLAILCGMTVAALVAGNTVVMKPAEQFRDHLTVVTELCDPLDGHATTVAAWLSGVIPKRTIAEDVHNGVTIDQVIAKQVGQDTVYPSIELATEDHSGLIGGAERV